MKEAIAQSIALLTQAQSAPSDQATALVQQAIDKLEDALITVVGDGGNDAKI